MTIMRFCSQMNNMDLKRNGQKKQQENAPAQPVSGSTSPANWEERKEAEHNHLLSVILYPL